MQDTQISSTFTFKFLITGDGSVGKTSIVNRLTRNDFESETEPTIGVEFITHVITVEGTPVKLQIWDTAGQEKYRSIGKSYYRNAVGVLLVFSLIDHNTFASLESWYSEVHPLCHHKARFILVGNKCDLESARAVSTDEAEAFAKAHGMPYLETSALANTNITEAFLQAAQDVFRLVVSKEISTTETESAQLIEPDEQDHSNKKQCCK